MAFTTATDRIDAVGKAGQVLGTLRTVYFHAKELRDWRALYLSGSDPTFNAAFEAVFNAGADRTELSSMIAQLTAVCVTDWENNHAAAIGLG